MEEITDRMDKLSLSFQTVVQKLSGVEGGQIPPTSGSSRSPNSKPSSNRRPRCIWCDSTEHRRRDCPELAAALNAGLIRYNDKGHLVNGTTGEELPLMFERGGMRAVASLPPGPPVAASTRTITVDVDGHYGHLGGDSILRTTLHFDEGTRTD